MKAPSPFLILRLLPFLIAPSWAYTQPSEIAAKLNGFDEWVEQVRQDWNVPGVAIAIVYKQETVYAKGFGYRDLEKQLPVTPNTLFAIGSTTKAMTAVSVGQLVDEGKIDLDKPLFNYLPDFRVFDEYVTSHMTPRDLMCHRSGLPRHDLAWYGSSRSREELFHALKYLKPNRGFREVYQYQNLMFMTAGYLVERLRQKPWEEVMRERLFKPLEMVRTNLSVEDSKKDADHALPYAENEGKLLAIPFRNIDAIGPAGSVNSSVTEMAHWLIMQLNGGKYKDRTIISAELLRQTHMPHIVTPSMPSEEVFYGSYGLGWGITSYRGHLRLGHSGGIDGFITQVILLPKDSIGVVVLTNSGSNLSAVIRNVTIDRMLGLDPIDWNKRLLEERDKARENQEKAKQEEDKDRVPGTNPTHTLDAYAGQFGHPGYGMIKIVVDGDHLRLQYNSFDVPLFHYHYDIFQSDDPQIGKLKVAFQSTLSGEIGRLSSQLEPAADPIVFERVSEE